MATLMLVAAARYFWWRFGTLNPDKPVLSFTVLGMELGLFFLSVTGINGMWNRVVRDSTPLRELGIEPERWPTVDVFIPCMEEPREILERTVAAALRLEYPAHKLNVYLLDDGARDWVRALVAELGATSQVGCHYIARTKTPGVPHHAKAGNLNHALFSGTTRGELVALFDSDQVVDPAFLQRTIPYLFDFDDRESSYVPNRVAFVQTPDSPWNVPYGDPLGNDSRVFYGPIQQASDGVGAVALTGSNVILRRAALAEIGGFYQESVTEDVPTGYTLFAAGWQGRYHSECLARGMAPEDLSSVLRQRLRWTEGAFQFLTKLEWKLIKRLSLSQVIELVRMVFLNYLHGVMVITFGLTLFLSAFCFGASFMVADPYEQVIHAIPFFLLSRLHFLVSCEGVPAEAVFRLEQQPFYHAPVTLLALARAFFFKSRIFFWVTPKTRVKGASISWLALPSFILSAAYFAGIGWLVYLAWMYSAGSPAVFLVSGLWLVHYLMCLWPAVRFSLWPAPAQERSASRETFSSRSPLRFLWLPTNIAGLAMSAIVIVKFGLSPAARPSDDARTIGQRFDTPLQTDILAPMQFSGFEWNEACFTAENVNVRNGVLRLEVNERRVFCQGGFKSHAAGGISTVAMVGPAFKLTCRLRPSAAAGVVSNCATYGTTTQSAALSWLSLTGGKTSEIDVGYVTSLGRFNRVVPLAFDARGAFHDYSIEFTSDRVIWSVDGARVLATKIRTATPRQWASVSVWPSSAYLADVASWRRAYGEVEAFFVEERRALAEAQ